MDNSTLNCRIKGLANKSPKLIILDRFLRIKKNLNIFKLKNKRKIYIYKKINNKNKIKWLKTKNVKVFIIKKLNSKRFYPIISILTKLNLHVFLLKQVLRLLIF